MIYSEEQSINKVVRIGAFDYIEKPPDLNNLLNSVRGALKSKSGGGKKVKKTIINVVVITNNKLVLKPKLDEAKTLGIIKNMINGLTIPPVK